MPILNPFKAKATFSVTFSNVLYLGIPGKFIEFGELMRHAVWQENLLRAVADLGEEGCGASAFLRAHKTFIGFWRVRKNVGAFWTFLGTIHFFNSFHYSQSTPLSDAGMLTLLIHEVKHLQQGIPLALSVFGELEAWQRSFVYIIS